MSKGELGELIDLPAREGAGARRPDGPDRTAVGKRPGENGELRVAEDIRRVDDRQAEAQVGLVGAIPEHGFFVSHARKWFGEFYPQHLIEHGKHQVFNQIHDSRRGHERHLHINLRVLRLTVGAQVLVAEGVGKLVVAVETRDHEELLEQLRRLRQGVKFFRLQTGRHQEVAGALGGALGQHRRFHLGETVFIEKTSRGT